MMHTARFAAFAILLFSTPASAAGDTAAAQALFEEARALMAKGDYTNACKKLEGSQALDPGPGTQFNLALCYEKSGRTASAWAAYLEAAAAYRATDKDWEAKANARAAQLAPTLAKVTITAAKPPPDLKVTRDGKAINASEIGAAIPLDPGHHVIEATAAHRSKFSSSFDLAAGASRTVDIVLTDEAAVTEPPPLAKSDGSFQTTAAYVASGVGIAGLVLGSVAGLVAKGKNDDSKDACPNDGVCTNDAALRSNNQAHDWATVSTIGFISGAVLVAAGVVLWVTAPKSKTVGIANGLVVTW